MPEYAYPDSEVVRIPVPASVFALTPQLPFVLFDRRGRLADTTIARTVYVAPSDATALDAYLRQRVQAIVSSRQVPAAARAWTLHHLLGVEVATALDAIPERSAALQPVTRLLALLAERLPGETGPYLAAAAQAGSDASTHAVATALYAMALGAAEGHDDRESLVAFGLAGVFADAALRRLPPELRARRGPLTAAEWDEVHRHPKQAADMLTHAGVRSAAALRAIRTHHERWDGSGYPEGLLAGAIPIEGRILAVADAYAAMTEERPYRPALRGYEALLDMSEGAGQFEPRLLRSFVRVLGQALSTGADWTPAGERDPQQAGEAA